MRQSRIEPAKFNPRLYRRTMLKLVYLEEPLRDRQRETGWKYRGHPWLVLGGTLTTHGFMPQVAGGHTEAEFRSAANFHRS